MALNAALKFLMGFTVNKRAYGPTQWGWKDLDVLKGYTIVRVGDTTNVITHWGTSSIEGGLTLLLEKDGERVRVIFGYTELGLWIETIEPYDQGEP